MGMRREIPPKVICCAVSLINDGYEQGPLNKLIYRWKGCKDVEIKAGVESALRDGYLIWEGEGEDIRTVLTEAGEKLIRSWILVVTKPQFGSEEKAMANLRAQGFEAWVPIYERTSLKGGKATKIRAPLFSRYVFVRKVAGLYDQRSPQRLSKILKTRHVHEVLCNTDGTPYWLPDSQIAGWRDTMEAAGGIIIFEGKQQPKRKWMHGDRVQINDGPLKDQFAFVMGPHFVGPDDPVALQLDKEGSGVRVSARDKTLSVPPRESERMPEAPENSGAMSKKLNKTKQAVDPLPHGRRPWRVSA